MTCIDCQQRRAWPGSDSGKCFECIDKAITKSTPTHRDRTEYERSRRLTDNQQAAITKARRAGFRRKQTKE